MLGRSVTNPAFTGLATELDPEFVEYLGMFVQTILSSENMTVKRSGGRVLRCKDMVHYFKSYMDILSVC